MGGCINSSAQRMIREACAQLRAEREAGFGPLLDQAAAGDKVAALALSRIRAAFVAMQPEIDRIRRGMWEGPPSASLGLALLIGPDV